MERNAASSQKAIRQSQSLCAGEQKYVRERKQVVLKTLKSLGINCTADCIPNIAFLASGGAQRAAVALIGSLYQMEKEGLLGTLLYLAGVSGSTWSMSNLYSDPQWSTNMEAAVSRLFGPEIEAEQTLAWLDERSKDEHFSLTDVWGVLTSASMKQMDLRHLSDDANGSGSNPYPIYCAMEKYHFSNGPTEGKWFEMSPHEAGFTELGLFVETSLLDSKFQGGELLEQRPEMDMIQLQGIFGSALGDEDTVIKEIFPWLRVARGTDEEAEEYLRVYNALVGLEALTRSTINSPTAFSDLDKLHKQLEDRGKRNQSESWDSRSRMERKGLSQQWIQDLLAEVQTWSQTLEDADVSHIFKQILPLILKWEWGTTANFLYQYHDGSIPPYLLSEERVHLIDAGIMINAAYPSFLGDKRDIDLIIAPDYSATMFRTVLLSKEYAAAVKKPFPEIDDKVAEDDAWPKDCYVFEGKGKEPTIVYMPLFNRSNCKDAEEVKAKREEFTTFQPAYSEEKIKFVLETAKANMKNNKDTLLREINKAALRRHQHTQSSNPSSPNPSSPSPAQPDTSSSCLSCKSCSLM